ncbi:MAG TPA: PAS domain S-box protein [Abditibacterium sp.]
MRPEPAVQAIFGEYPYASLVAEIRDFAIFLVDTEGKIVSWNEGARLLFGYEKSEIVGQDSALLFVPEDLERGVPEQELSTAAQEGRAEDVRWHLKKDNTSFWANGVTTAMRDEAGKLMGYAKIARDETDRKKIEDDLRSSQERFELVARATNDAIWDWDLATDEIWWNSNVETVFGYSAQEIHPVSWWEEYIHPDDRERVMDGLRHVIESGKHFWKAEHRYKKVDGSYVHVLNRGYVLRDETGKPKRALGAVMDLSIQKQLEADHQIFRQLADNSPDFVAMCDMNLNPTYRNAQVPRLMGVRTGEMALNPQIADYFYPEDQAFVFDEFFPRVIREGQGITEIRLRHLQTGAPVWMSYQLFVLRDIEGNPAALATISRDISVRKTMELALRRSEERYRTLFEAIDNGFCVIEMIFDANEHPIDYRFLEVNPAFERQTGLQNAQGKTIREMVPNLDEFWFQTYGKVAVTGESIHFENAATAMDRFFDVYAFRVEAPHERRVALLFTDITARKKGEAEREELVRSLDAERQLLSMIYETSPAFVCTLRGRDLVFEMANPAYYQLIGHREIIGKPLLEALPEVDGQGYVEVLHGVLDSGQSLPIYERPVLLQREANGPLEERIINLLYTPLRDPDGTISRIFAHGVDITDQVRARRAAEEANRVKDEFLATLSHELRTPLTAIMGWASILQDKKLNAEEVSRGVATIARNARAQSQLIEDILDVSRVITGKLRLEVQPVDVTAIIEEAVSTVAPAAAAKEIRLQRVLDTGDSIVLGDGARLQQIIWNLLSNAIKFTPRAGRVQIKLERINSHLEITVADTGMGIAPEILPHVFERFRQADSTSTRSHGGLGLGLAIVRHLTELHGGNVEAQSEGLQKGASFVVKLPLAAVNSQERYGENQERRAKPKGDNLDGPLTFPALDGLHVLVVDDQEDTRVFVKLLLERSGARVSLAESAAHGLLALRETRPDILLSDIGMPEEDGYSLIQKVRALPKEQGGHTPAAALTAFARTEDRVKALRAGFQIHLPKPIEPLELATVVANLAGRMNES